MTVVPRMRRGDGKITASAMARWLLKSRVHKSNPKDKLRSAYGEDLSESSIDTALKNKAEKTGVPVKFLRQVYNKGLAAWRVGHRPGASQHAWAMGRVNSFLVGGPARKVDQHIWDAYQEHKKKEG